MMNHYLHAKLSSFRVATVTRRVGVPLVLAVTAGGWLTGLASTAEAAGTTTSFTVPACATQNWTVPSGVTAAVFDVYGAAGGSATQYGGGAFPGGDGGYVRAALAVSAGQVLTITAGGGGGGTTVQTQPVNTPGGAGGCGGGGTGGAGQGAGTSDLTLAGAGGGGASEVSVSGAAPLLVAAGGGGSSYLGYGGQGGPQTGGTGSANAILAIAATGGTQTAGGQPGQDRDNTAPTTAGATAGGAGSGGTGGSEVAVEGAIGGGGGGGGWYGGGGGAADGGGGGSNYISSQAFNGVSEGGINPGQGHVTVTYGAADFPSFTGSPSDGTIGAAYSYQFQSASWPAPQFFTTDPAALPPGVTLSADGTLSGTPTTSGSYTFVVGAANPLGASSQAITMKIDAEPQVTTQPASQTVAAGQPVTFTAAASGYPAPGIQWQTSSDGTTWSDVTAATGSSLTFTATSKDNGNTYRAVFTNAAGSATTTAASLAVTTANPTLTDNPAAGAVGTKVTIAGANLQPSAIVSIRLGSATGQLLATTTASASGAISVALKFPAATHGTKPVYAVTGGSVVAKTTFTVEPHLALPSKAIAPGKTAKATVTGFKADQQVTVRLTSAKGRKLATLTTSTTGSGTATLTIPASTKAGDYQVYASGAGQPTATATIKVS